MVPNLMKRRAAPPAVCLLLLLLSACTFSSKDPSASNIDAAISQAAQESYDSGYSKGYDDGFTDGQRSTSPELTVPQTADTSAKTAGFVLLSEAVPDAILEIRYYSSYNFAGRRIAGYEEPTALLTQEAAEALRAVSDDLLRQGYRLKIYDAYRPQCAVDDFKAWALDLEDQRMKPYFYPDMEKSRLFAEGYIASRSGHSRGSTVDLTLFEMSTGKEADMGGVFDFFGLRSHADYQEDLTEAQIANRKLLRDTMLAHGFKGISTEWWHFTLKNEPYPDTYFNFPVAVPSVA